MEPRRYVSDYLRGHRAAKILLLMTFKHLFLLLVLASVNTSAALGYLAPSTTAKLVMPRRPVRSSDIASIGYDANSSTLEVEFLNGGVYQYYQVPQAVYEGLMNASSHGSYFAARVKGVYHYRQMQ